MNEPSETRLFGIEAYREKDRQIARERILVALENKLVALDLSDLNFLDALPEELVQLSQLETLYAPLSGASDISMLSNLVQLRRLEVGSSRLTNLMPLRECKRLTFLALNCSHDASIEPLNELAQLEHLSVSGFDGNLAPVANLVRLRVLRVSGVRIEHLKVLQNFTAITDLIMNSIMPTDYSVIAHLTRLRRLGLMAHDQKDVSLISILPNLVSLRLYAATSVDISPLSNLSQLETLVLNGKIENLHPIENLTSLTKLDIRDTEVSDLSPIAKLVGLVFGADRDRLSGGLRFTGRTMSDSALRSIGNVGQVKRTRRVLAHLRQQQGLPDLDSAVAQWIKAREFRKQSWEKIIAEAKASPLGVRFVRARDQLTIDYSGDRNDVEASDDLVTRQLHEGVKRKALDFVPIAVRLNNHLGWQGIGNTAERFARSIGCSTIDIPSRIGDIYNSVIELGSYLELDHRLRSHPESNSHPLDLEAHRALSDLIRTAAPWVRRFPTARHLDNEAGAFLTRAELLEPSLVVTEHAEKSLLIPEADAKVIRELIDAARRGEFQGQKAATRGVASTRNLILAAASVLTTFYLGAIGSDFATKSQVVMRAGTFLHSAEASVTELFSESPTDIRQALISMLDELRQQSEGNLPSSPVETPFGFYDITKRRKPDDEEEE